MESQCLDAKPEFDHLNNVYSDSKGNIQYFEPEEILFGPEDFWDESGKDKHKVKKLEIKNAVY